MSVWRRLDEVTRRPEFGPAAVFVVCAVVLGLAASMDTTETVVSWFGWDVPVVCGFRRMTGVPCPGCGLTRSFVFLAHGHPWDAFRVHPFGPVVFAFVAAQLPWQALRLRALRAGPP